MRKEEGFIDKLARWNCQLNSFIWPADFPVSPPAGYESMTTTEKYKNTKIKLLYWITLKLAGRKEVMRYWHTSGLFGLNETNKEFEAWWEDKDRNLFHET